MADSAAAQFAPGVVSPLPGGISEPVIVDLDGDGTASLVAMRSNEVVLFRHLGDGSFGPGQVIVPDVGDELRGFAVADIDGDGDQDVYVVQQQRINHWDQYVIGHRNDGGGAYSCLLYTSPSPRD